MPPAAIGAGVVRETIDATAFAKWRADVSYRPKGMSDWAQRVGADPGRLEGTVLAADGRPVPEEPSAVQARPNLA